MLLFSKRVNKKVIDINQKSIINYVFKDTVYYCLESSGRIYKTERHNCILK